MDDKVVGGEKVGLDKAWGIINKMRKDLRDSNGYSSMMGGYYQKRDVANLDNGLTIAMKSIRYYQTHGKVPLKEE